MISSGPEDCGVAIVGFSFRGPQTSVTHPPHGSTYLDSRKPQAGRESNLRGTVVAFESGPLCARLQSALIQMPARDAARNAAGVTPN